MKSIGKETAVINQKGGESMEDMLYTVPEVAKILKTNVDYVYRLNQAGLLKFIKVGRLKCRKESLEKFLEKYDGKDISNPFNVCDLTEDTKEVS